MSFLARLWTAIRNPVRSVGRDLEGNQFYEQHLTAGQSRPKRTVTYRDSEEVWQYIGGKKRLPIQWSAWLSHTRPLPPTLEELQSDLQRQMQVRYNASLIEARDREESEKMARFQAETHAELLKAPQRSQNDGHVTQSSEEPRQPRIDEPLHTIPPESESRSEARSFVPDPWDVPKEDTKEWSPTLRERGA